MEITLINENKLKVMLSYEDLERFGIDTQELDYNNAETRWIFWNILSRAKHDVGFDTNGSRILVQLYPSREGGYEMLITKIGSSDTKSTKNAVSKKAIKETSFLPCIPPHPAWCVQEAAAFGFDCLEHFLFVCRRLHDIGYAKCSTAYCGNDHRYYLFLDQAGIIAIPNLHVSSFLTEYGSAENAEEVYCFLEEYGKCICSEHAVEELGNLSY